MEQQQQQQQQGATTEKRKLCIIRRKNNTEKPPPEEGKSVVKLIIIRRPNKKPTAETAEGNRENGVNVINIAQPSPPTFNGTKKAAASAEHNKERSSRSSRGGNQRKEKMYFDPYYPMEKCAQWLKDKVLLEGSFRPTFNNKKSFVTVTSFGHSTPFRVSIEGLRDQNRAFENDIVIIELYPPITWKKIKIEEEEEEEEEDGDGDGDENEVNNEGNDHDEDDKKKEERIIFLGDEWITRSNNNNNNDNESKKNKEEEEENENENENEKGEKEKSDVIDYTKVAADKAAWNRKAYEERFTMMAQGRVVAIKRVANTYRIHSGYIEPPERVPMHLCNSHETFRFKSVNRRAPWADVNRRWCKDFAGLFAQLGDSLTDYVYEAQFAEWTETQQHPQVDRVHALGKFGDIEVETCAILSEYDVPSAEVSAAAAACLPKLPWSIPASELAARRDLRDRCVYTVDPLGARDLDDAVSCWPCEDGSGNLCVGVHIADVSYFVRPDTELDREAAKRSTSTYLVQRVIPMLPRVLCEDLCSLNPGVDRLAFSCVWTMTPDSGEIVDEWFGRTVIRSCCKLSYDVAQGIIDGKADTARFPATWDGTAGAEFLTEDTVVRAPHTTAEVAASIGAVARIARALRRKRFDEEGTLKIGMPKLTVILNAEGAPVGVRRYPIRESNELVEDMMLLANRRVALRLSKFFPSAALLRRHPSPKRDLMDEFCLFCARFAPDVTVDTSSSLALRLSVDRLAEAARARYGPEYEDLVSLKLVRTMCLAEYFSATTIPNVDDWAHYGLGFSHYTHFTSPIRRYPDLLVHRQLQASIDIERGGNKMDSEVTSTEASLSPTYFLSGEFNIAKICEHSNDRKMAARKCQDASTDLFITALIRDRPITTYGIVSKIEKDNVGVFLPEYCMEKSFSLKNLPVVKYTVTKGTKGEHHHHLPCVTVFWAKDPAWAPKKMSSEEQLCNEVEVYAGILAKRDDAEAEIPLSSLVRGKRVIPILQEMDSNNNNNNNGNVNSSQVAVGSSRDRKSQERHIATILDAIRSSKVLTVAPSGKGVFYNGKKATKRKEEEGDVEEEGEEKIETITQEIGLFEKIKVILGVHPTRRPLETAVNIIHPASFPGVIGPSPILVRDNDDDIKGKSSNSLEESFVDDI